MRAALMALVATLILAVAGPPDAAATHEVTFVTTLIGAAEVPPNRSTARGTAVVVIESDGRVTYAVNSTGFETQFRAAHIHTGAPDVAGPIVVPLDCDEDGRVCSGTSAPLDAATLTAFTEGNTYINLHTDQFAGGEIRGQLRSILGTPPATAGVTRFAGKASGVGVDKGSEIKIKGRFTSFDSIDLVTSTAAILVLLSERGGAGELVANALSAPLLSVALLQPRPDSRGKEAVFSTVLDGGDPGCRLKVKRLDDELYEYSLECKRNDGAKIPSPPTLCSSDRHPKTNLRTWIVLSAGTAVGIDVTQPWRCLGRNGNVRELKAVELKGTNKPVAPGPGPQPAENEPPKADFRAEPRDGTAPLSVNFENRSTDRDGDALTFEWNFGDGATSTEENPTHVYLTPGRFDVRLVVRDARGGVSHPKEQDVEVKPAS